MASISNNGSASVAVELVVLGASFDWILVEPETSRFVLYRWVGSASKVFINSRREYVSCKGLGGFNIGKPSQNDHAKKGAIFDSSSLNHHVLF